MQRSKSGKWASALSGRSNPGPPRAA
uniref:Uncharacterized protein n=1 Tax=Anguilla anguilla TaxID=7936 RepID=A0A0E9RT73_ANGAN